MKYHFLWSSERSGSNLITKLLNANQLICGPSPTHCIRLIAQNINRYGNLKNDKNWNIFITDIHAYLSNILGELEANFSLEGLRKITPRSSPNIIKYIYDKEAKSQNKDILFIKENRVYQYLPYILTHFPNSKHIYIVRDPRDTILSYKKAINIPVGLMDATKIWIRDQTNFLLCYGFLKEASRCKIYQYENLISNTPDVLNDICNFLNVPYSQSMMDYHMEKDNKLKANKWHEWKNLEKPVMEGNFNKFEKELSVEEIIYIENKASKLMETHNYRKYIIENNVLNEQQLLILKNENAETLKYKDSLESSEIRTNRLNIIENVLTRKFNLE